ncbi:MAG: hypothetical protein ACP5FK_00355 [bacterium]
MNIKNIIYLFLLLSIGCSTPQPIEVTSTDSLTVEAPVEKTDSFAIIIVNYASMYNPVASEFMKQDSQAITEIIETDSLPFYFVKANSFFPPPETTISFILYSASTESRLLEITSYTDKLISYLNNKYHINLNSYKCIWFSPGRTFFRPVKIFQDLSDQPVFIWTDCRDLSRESGKVWETHRLEWDRNISWLAGFHKFSLAAANADEAMPQNNNILYAPAHLLIHWDSILPCEGGQQDLIVIVAGSDLMLKLGF